MFSAEGLCRIKLQLLQPSGGVGLRPLSEAAAGTAVAAIDTAIAGVAINAANRPAKHFVHFALRQSRGVRAAAGRPTSRVDSDDPNPVRLTPARVSYVSLTEAASASCRSGGIRPPRRRVRSPRPIRVGHRTNRGFRSRLSSSTEPSPKERETPSAASVDPTGSTNVCASIRQIRTESHTLRQVNALTLLPRPLWI